MSTPEYIKYFYLRKVEEVRLRMATKDYYHVIMASGLLRHLLLDDFPLAHKANQELRLKLRFEVVDGLVPSKLEMKKVALHYGQLEPLPDYPVRTKTIKESELLKTYCMTVEEHEFTVKEILESCAYARGGVHLHSPSARDTALFLTDAVGFFGTPMTIAMINQIVNVILKGLQPLTDALTVEFEQKKAAGGS